MVIIFESSILLVKVVVVDDLVELNFCYCNGKKAEGVDTEKSKDRIWKR